MILRLKRKRSLTQTGDDYSPVYSPDGKSLAFIRNARFAVDLRRRIRNRNASFAKFYTDLAAADRQTTDRLVAGQQMARISNQCARKSFLHEC